MNRTTLLPGAILALCLIGMLALPASAAPLAAQPAAAAAGTVDQGLKDELWANHMQYRLARFDLNVEQGRSVTGILGKYSIDTSACQETLAAISGKRAELASALRAQDREQLRTVNGELKTLGKQFLKDLRDAIRSRYGRNTAGITDGTLDGLVPGAE